MSDSDLLSQLNAPPSNAEVSAIQSTAADKPGVDYTDTSRSMEDSPQWDSELQDALTHGGAVHKAQFYPGEKEALDQEVNDRKAAGLGVNNPTKVNQQSDLLSQLNDPNQGLLDQLNAPEKPGFFGRLSNDYSASAKELQGTVNSDKNIQNPVADTVGLGLGVARAGAEFGLQALNTVERGVAYALNPTMAEKYLGGMQGITESNQDITKKLSGLDWLNTPAAKAGYEAANLPFAGIKTLVESLPAGPIQEAASAIALIAAPLAHHLMPKAKAPEVAGPDLTLKTAETAPEGPQAAPTPEQATTPTPKTQGDLFGTEDLTGGGPPSGGMTREATGTQVANPFLDPKNLTVDENGMPRDAGLSADVQREAYDFPKMDDLLAEANKYVAEQATRDTSPAGQDHINLLNDAFQAMKEQHENLKATQVDQAYRDYEASQLVPKVEPEVSSVFDNVKAFFLQDLEDAGRSGTNRPIGGKRYGGKQSGSFDPTMFGDLAIQSAKALSEVGKATGKTALFGAFKPRDSVERDAREMVDEGIGERPSSTDINGKPRDPALLAHLNDVYDRAVDIIKTEKKDNKDFRFQGAGFRDSFTGEVHNTGPIHNTKALPAEAQAKPAGVMEAGFIGNDGKFYTRQEAASKLKQIELVSNIEGGVIHSSNLFKDAAAARKPAVKERRSAERNALDPTGIYGEAPHFDRRTPTMIEADRAVQNSNPNFGKFKQGGGVDWSLFYPKALINWLTSHKDKSGDVLDFAKDDTRSANEFIDDSKAAGFDPTVDIKSQIGFHTGSFRAIMDVIKNPASLAARTLMFYDNKIRQFLEQNHMMNYAVDQYWKPIHRFYGNTASRIFKLADFTKDLSTVLKMEGGEGWFDGTNYVPTVKNLIDAGMRPEAAQVWNKILSSADTMWDTANKAATMAGTDKVKRIPGYVPHQFRGPYAVRVYKEHIDPDTGAVRKEYAATVNSHSRRAQMAQYNYLKKSADAQGLKIDLVDPTAEGNTVGELFNSMWIAANVAENKTGFAKLAKSLYENAAEGIVTSMLDRNDPTQIGFALDRAGMNGILGLTRGEVKDAFNGIQETHKAVNDWYNKVKFVNEVLFPLDSGGMLSQPNLRRAVKDYTSQYLRVPNTIFKEFDIKVRDTLINNGLDPALFRNIMSGSSSVFSKLYLVAKPAFYIANRFQSIYTPGILLSLKAENGGKGSVLKALWDAKGEILSANIPFKKPTNLIQQGLARGRIQPSFMENMGSTLFQDPISSHIEMTTRSESYAVSYHFFKQFQPKEEALKSAGAASDMVSVDYSDRRGIPLLMSRTPISARPLLLFMTYNQHYLGVASHSIKVLVDRTSAKDFKGAANAAAGIMATQGLMLGLFGLGGMTYMQNADTIIKAINKAFGYTISTSRELARSIGQASGLPWLGASTELGGISVATGIDVSGSGQGAALALPSAFTGMLSSLGLLAIVASGANKENGSTKDEIWKAASSLPATITGPLEHFLKGDYKDILPQITEDMESYRPGKEGLHSRKDLRVGGTGLAGQLGINETALNYAGAKSTRQADYDTSSNIDFQHRQSAQTNINHLVNLIQESKDPKVKQQAAKELTTLYNQDPNSILSAIQKYQLEANLTEEQRKAKAASQSPITAGRWYKNWLEINGGAPMVQGK